MKKQKIFYSLLLMSLLAFINIIKVDASVLPYFLVDSSECQELFGPGSMEILRTVMTIIRWVIPLVLIALVAFDFVKAVTGNNPTGDLNKAVSNTIKRLIIAAIIFLFPDVLNLLLKIINSSTCGL